MLKTLLLNPPSKIRCARVLHRGFVGDLSYVWPPVDLIYLGGILKNFGIDFSFRDYQSEKLEPLDDLLFDEKYDVVISTYSSFIEQEDLLTLSAVKKVLPESQLLLLATHADRMDTIHIKKLLASNPFVDALIYDFANNECVEFLTGEKTKSYKNIFYLSGNELFGDISHLPLTVSLPIPDHNKFRSKNYFHYDGQNGDLATIMGSFGCKMPCKFCWGPDIYPKVTMRDPINLVDEIESIVEKGFKEIYFHDYTFAYRKNEGKNFCRELINRQIKVRWYCSARIDLMDEELISLMAKSGCKCIEFGIESGNYDVRKKYGKNFKDEVIEKAVEFCKSQGIHVSIFVILGLPEEDLELMHKSVKFVESLNIDYVAYNILWVEPKTSLMQTMGELVKEVDPHDSMNYLNFKHPSLTQQDIIDFKNKCNRSFYLRPRVIIRHLIRMLSLKKLTITLHAVKKLFFRKVAN